ncbi:Uncharacterised protein [Shewanella algae]|uniref:Uncharacterized protein n=2 Tax=Shewanella algae TaxID=38313 RepID=A0A380AJR6_9GAMM|nr:Uncharacterised protein [Shewanella algae]
MESEKGSAYLGNNAETLTKKTRKFKEYFPSSKLNASYKTITTSNRFKIYYKDLKT